ncbi:MAG: HesA/MoeB/ThiF family protein [Candidatus Cloacimonetes bacterium]|nr:HesA/MoeB/ThiF family protein [Candidatus Cloacimonadota bacterium]MCF7812930.1 HesA/MoeB/ThiF family protein [Candidatus Cloacimonadota bacterium]MCF7867142.1 HesA/MoeB/ThiF family protein [Candidatus Cloacimonadota bacterium]MCF7882538.1 HesA/MoeB/ThiF family protein [Candidatus Cloacimonadota bacterium]
MPEIFQKNIQFWGEENQQKIADASILIAGVGGLGCVVAEGLTRAGIGKLILVDNGIVEASNLNRQILFDQSHIGKVKVQVAKQKLQAINPKLEIEILQNSIMDLKNILLSHYDGIADCLDNFASRFELEKLLTPDHFLVHGGVQNDFGQIITIKPGKTQTLRHIYPGSHIPISTSIVPQTVIIIGSLIVQEIINNIFDKPQLLNKMLIIELADFSMFKVALTK